MEGGEIAPAVGAGDGGPGLWRTAMAQSRLAGSRSSEYSRQPTPTIW